MDNNQCSYIEIIKQQFEHFKERAEEAIEQLSEQQLHWKPNEESNNRHHNSTPSWKHEFTLG
jgi:hypothetical protein